MTDQTTTPATIAPTVAAPVVRQPPQRDARGYWLPGQTGNPGGKPKAPRIDGKTMHQILNEMVPKALEIQSEMLLNPETPTALRNTIVQSILDRTMGKAVNQIDVTSVNLTQTVSKSRIDASALSLDQLRLLASIDAMIADDVNGDD